jgi:hypothetical protein
LYRKVVYFTLTDSALTFTSYDVDIPNVKLLRFGSESYIKTTGDMIYSINSSRPNSNDYSNWFRSRYSSSIIDYVVTQELVNSECCLVLKYTKITD